MNSPLYEYEAADGQRDFDVPFTYLDRSHVEVRVNAIRLAPQEYEWVNAARVRLKVAPGAGAAVTLLRDTPIDNAMVQFQNGAVLTQEDLNLAVQQLLYKQQELTAIYEASLAAARVRLAENLGIVTDPRAIVDELTNMVLETELLDEFQQRINDIDLNSVSILNQAEQIVGLATGIATEQTIRQTEDEALASQITAVVASVGDNAAAILAEATARADADEAEATARLALASQVGANEAAILSESTTRSTADEAFAGQFSLLGAKNAEGTAWLLDEGTVKVAGGVSLGSRLLGIDTALGGNAAAIVSEQNARVSADSAIASDVSTLSTTVGGHTSSISTIQTSVNGLTAKYGVSINVNGHVTGFVQNNDGTTGDFTILADKFAIVDPGGGTPFVPFEVSGGVVRIKEASIGTLNVSKLTTGVLGANITQNGEWLLGTGKIVFDNGTYMKVQGLGFGSSNQFLEWFGPKVASYSLMTESNAIAYLKTNGSAYFGGTLASGILKNSAQTTNTAADASVTVGPFSTNGNTKTIVLSYEWKRTYTANSSTGSMAGGSATIVLERNLGGSWVTIGTLTANPNHTVVVDGEPGIPDQVTGRLVGSTTITDNSAATSNMTLRARITARTLPTAGGTGITSDVTTQNISVISTE